MQLTLREEVLVAVNYENPDFAIDILRMIQSRRKVINDLRHLEMSELSKILFVMVEFDNLLEAWKLPLQKLDGKSPGKSHKHKVYLVRVGSIEESRINPLRLYYRLTPHGWRTERQLMKRLLERGDKKGEGRSQ